MVLEPHIANDELVYAVRAWHGDASLAVRVRRRRRLRPTAGLTGSYFERVHLEIDGQRFNVLLKQGGLPFGPQTRESVFFAHLSPHVQVRAPRCFGVGRPVAGQDAWVLMERLPRGKRLVDWSEEETRQALRNLAALHAQYVDDPPLSVPQPFTRDLDETLSFVEGGAHALRERYLQFPHFPRIISDRALDLAVELSRRTEIFRDAFTRSPQTLLHGDYHRGNLLARDGEPQCMFDWQFVCVGPPAYDLAVFWLWLGAVNKRGFLGFIDRVEVRERCLSWEETFDVYADALRGLRPDVDVDAIASCSEEALAWEPLRQVTYFGPGMQTFEGLVRFAYRDHRRIGGWFMKWLGVDAGFDMYRSVFADFEQRVERLLAAAPSRDRTLAT